MSLLKRKDRQRGKAHKRDKEGMAKLVVLRELFRVTNVTESESKIREKNAH